MLAIAIGAVFAFGVLFLLIYPQTQKEYAGSIAGGPEYFYKSEIENMIGRRLTDKKNKFGGEECTKCYYEGEKERGYDHLVFYLFKDGKTAEKAFESIDENEELTHKDSRIWGYIRRDLFSEIDFESAIDPDALYLRNIMDFEYYYIYGNLIVEYSKRYETSIAADISVEYVASNDPARDHVLELIPKIFNAEGKKNHVYVEGEDVYIGEGSTNEISFDYGTSDLELPDDNYRNYYEIFVYSFYDSNGDGIGDLKGVTEKLDYVADMGFNGIWLMPIFPSPTYHKYDATDYMAVDEQYGTIEDFDELIEEAHKRGINIIIDLAINHTSSQHPWFKDAVKYLRSLEDGQEPDYDVCPYAAYYHFAHEPADSTWYNINGSDKWYYEGSFWSEMPDLDLSCEALWVELEKTADFWIDHGVDGFRMDAPLHYEENSTEFNAEALNRLYTYCTSKDPDFYMVSEVWSAESTITDYYKSLTPSMFNFDIAQAEGKLIRAGNGKYKAEKLVEAMLKYQEEFGANNPDYIDAPFLTNHDMPRVANALNNNPDALKKAAGLLMTCSGSPFVYYGEEIGMCSQGKKDENKRLPMLWNTSGDADGTTRKPADADSGIVSAFEGVEEQLSDPDSILNYYRRALRMRNENPEIARGYITIIDGLTDGDVAVIIKATEDGSCVAIAYNTSKETVSIDLSKAGTVEAKTGLECGTVNADPANMECAYILTVSESEMPECGLDGSGKLTLTSGAIVILR